MAEDDFSQEQMQQLQAVFQGAIHNALNNHLQPVPTNQLQSSVANPLQREFTNLADLITDMYEQMYIIDEKGGGYESKPTTGQLTMGS
ncbi:hypothetical protein LTR10_008404 [Elasticomyces elasticus]|nr:hypothetical protein LTR10_008404 [Elasticomyces elasticus]KAK4967278.1 hypothetical protein LTR42_010627 [Elasticomyces elasticus]